MAGKWSAMCNKRFLEGNGNREWVLGWVEDAPVWNFVVFGRAMVRMGDGDVAIAW